MTLRRITETDALSSHHSDATPLCRVVAYKSGAGQEAVYSVNVRMETPTLELEHEDYDIALEAIVDAIRDLRSGRTDREHYC